MVSIQSKYKRISNRINKGYADLRALEAECTHPSVKKAYGGNTGNYLNKDVYWIDYHCPDCNKQWREDQ